MNIELKFLKKKSPTDTGVCQILQNLSDSYAHILNILLQGLGFFCDFFFPIWKFLATEEVGNEIYQNPLPQTFFVLY